MADKQQQGAANRRRRLYIDKDFQNRFLLFIGAFAIAAAVLMFLMASLFWTPGGSEQAGAYQLGDAVATLLLVVLGVIIIVIIYGIRFSHRIAGPIYALGRNMTFVNQGKYVSDLTLREKDEFQALAKRFNTMLETLRSREQTDIEALMELKERLEKLGAGEEGAQLITAIDTLLARKEAYLK